MNDQSKQVFTVERAYLCPVYVHIKVEATSPEEAARLAMDEATYPWDGDKIDYENSRATYVDGIWRGDAYSHASYEVPADLRGPEPMIPEAILRVDQIMALRQVVENEAETLNNTDFDSPVDADGARAIHATALEAVEVLEKHHSFPAIRRGGDQPAGFVGHPLCRILTALRREFSTANARITSGDSISFTDADGDDWTLILKGPAD